MNFNDHKADRHLAIFRMFFNVQQSIIYKIIYLIKKSAAAGASCDVFFIKITTAAKICVHR